MVGERPAEVGLGIATDGDTELFQGPGEFSTPLRVVKQGRVDLIRPTLDFEISCGKIYTTRQCLFSGQWMENMNIHSGQLSHLPPQIATTSVLSLGFYIWVSRVNKVRSPL